MPKPLVKKKRSEKQTIMQLGYWAYKIDHWQPKPTRMAASDSSTVLNWAVIFALRAWTSFSRRDKWSETLSCSPSAATSSSPPSPSSPSVRWASDCWRERWLIGPRSLRTVSSCRQLTSFYIKNQVISTTKGRVAFLAALRILTITL